MAYFRLVKVTWGWQYNTFLSCSSVEKTLEEACVEGGGTLQQDHF